MHLSGLSLDSLSSNVFSDEVSLWCVQGRSVTVVCSGVKCHCGVFMDLKVQEMLRERFCRQKLPDRPEGVEAQHK